MFENVFLQIRQMLWLVVAFVALEIGTEQVFRLRFPGLERDLAFFSQVLQNLLGVDEIPRMFEFKS